MKGCVDPGPGLRHRHAGLQSRKKIDPVGFSVFESFELRLQHTTHGNRNIDVRAVAQSGSIKTHRRHTDNGHRLAVYDQGVVQYGWTRLKSALPVRMAQDDNWRLTDGAVVGGTQQAAKCRLYSQHLKIAAGNLRAVPAGCLPVKRKIGSERAMRSDT